MSNIFNINYNKLAGELLFTFLRKLKNSILTQACLKPIAQLHGRFIANREANIYKAEHNGQVCYLRGMLNDTFDYSARRIRIDEAPHYDAVMFYRRSEDKPVMFNTVLFSRRGYISTKGYDFVVYVPAELQPQETRMRALINYYRLVSKQYTIQYF